MSRCTYKSVLKPRKNSDGTQTVTIRLTKNRVQKYVYTDIHIVKSYWNDKGTYEKGNWIRNTHPLHEVYNHKIKAVIQKAEKIKEDLPIEIVFDMLSGRIIEGDGFIKFCKEQAEVKKSKSAPATYQKYQTEIKKLSTYLKEKELPFERINYEFLQKYEAWMMGSENKNGQNTASKSIKFIRVMIKEAVRSKRMRLDQDPFMIFTIKEVKVKKERLTMDEVVILEKIPLNPDLKIFDARSVWMTQFNCAGARVSDVIKMRWESIRNDRWYYTMGKTGEEASIKLNEKVIEILKYYGYGQKKEGWVFPFLEDSKDYSDPNFLFNEIKNKTARINNLLRDLMKKTTIGKKLSTHIARHSFSSIVMSKTKDVYGISKALRHSSISVTERYLNSLDEGASDDVINVLG